MTEIEILVDKAIEGDSEAYRKLYTISSRQVYFTCLGIVKNVDDAEDLMQETFFTVMIKLADLKDKNKFQAWVNRIAVNKCKNFLNKKTEYSVEEEFEESVNDIVDAEIILPDEYVENEEKRKIIMKIVMNSLSDVQRQTIVMYYYNEMTVAEIAEELGCSTGTVTYRLSSARKLIEKEVLKYEKINNEHIHAVLPIPFLTSLFKAECDKVHMPEIDFSSISQAAAGILATAGKTANIITSKAVAAMTAVVIGGGSAGYYISTKLDEKLYVEKDSIQLVSDNKAEPVFTDVTVQNGYATVESVLSKKNTIVSSVLSSDLLTDISSETTTGSISTKKSNLPVLLTKISALALNKTSASSLKKISSVSVRKTSVTSTAIRKISSVLSSVISRASVTSATRTTTNTVTNATVQTTASVSVSDSEVTSATVSTTMANTVVAEQKLDISLANTHAAYIGVDGTLYVWGNNEYGQLGNGTTENQSEPVAIMEGTKFISVSTGLMNTAALDINGNLYVWGNNRYGQIGNNTLESSSTPVKVMENVSIISIGDCRTAAVTEDGTLYTWGAYEVLLPNDIVDVCDVIVPTKILENVKYIDLHANRYAAITEDGTLYTWGADPVEMVYGGADYISPEPVAFSRDLNFKSVKLSETLSSALTEDGSLYMWGINSKGGIGDGTRTNRANPVKVLENVREVDLSNHHVGAITEDGQLYMWGYNAYGQLGDGTTEDALSPKLIMEGTKFVDLNAVANYTMVVAEDGTEYTWGVNKYS